MNRARNKARPDPKLYIFKKNKCLFQFTLDLIRVSPALSQKHKYQFSAEVSCLPLSEKHLLRTTVSSCSRKLLSPFCKNTREQFALLKPSGGTGPELTMSRYPLRIDGFGLFIDSLHSSDASSTLPAWALRFWTAAAHADVCVCVSTAGPIFLSGVCIWWLSMKMMSWDKEKERDTEAVMKCCRDVYTQIIFHVYFCPWRRRQTYDRTCQRRRLAVFSPCHSSRMYLSISWQFFRRQSQFLTPHSVQSAAPLRLVLLGARETDGDHGKKNS